MSIQEQDDKLKGLWLKALGKQLRAERTKKNYSGTDFIHIIEPANLFRIERGEINPSAYLIKQICDFLEIDLAEFYLKIKKSTKS